MPQSDRRKPTFKLIVTPQSISILAPKPKRSTIAIIVLILLLTLLLLVAISDEGLRSRALESVLTVVEAMLPFWSAALKRLE